MFYTGEKLIGIKLEDLKEDDFWVFHTVKNGYKFIVYDREHMLFILESADASEEYWTTQMKNLWTYPYSVKQKIQELDVRAYLIDSEDNIRVVPVTS